MNPADSVSRRLPRETKRRIFPRLTTLCASILSTTNVLSLLSARAESPVCSHAEDLLHKPFPPLEESMAQAPALAVNIHGASELSSGSAFKFGHVNWLAASEGAAPAEYKAEHLFSWDYLSLLGEDIAQTFTAPARWETRDWLIFSGVASGLAGLTFLDERIQRAVQRNRNETVKSVCNAVEPFGAEYSFGVVGAFYLSGELFKDERAKAVGLDGLSASIIASGLITTPMKYIVGRSRPPAEQGAGSYEPFSNNHSFPSGHATQAFAVATVISEHYDSLWVKGSAYTLASMVGFSRMNKNSHWASDVVAGAVIGIFVGHEVVRFNETHRHVALTPIIGPGIQAVQLGWTF